MPSDDDPVASLAQSLALRFGADADELAQATRVAAWRHLGDVRAPLAWARRVALNALRQDRRAAGRRGEHEARAAADRSAGRGPLAPDEILGAIEVRRAVLDAIEALPADERAAVVMRYLEDRSLADVARAQGIPLETLRSRLRRARARLRRSLEGQADPGSALSGFLLTSGLGVRELPFPAALGAALTTMKTQNAALAAGIGFLLVAGTWFLASGDRSSPADPVSSDPARALAAPTSDAPAPDPEAGDAAARVAMAPSTPAPKALGTAPVPTITGQVVDLNGRGVSGARVVVSGGEEHEDAPMSRSGGAFDWPVHDRQVRLTALLDGHVAVLEGTLQEGAKGTPLIVLAPAIQIGGRTEDGGGEPLPDASLRVELPETWSVDLGRNLAGGRAFSLRGRSGPDGAFGPWTVPAVPGTLIWASGPVHTDLYRCPEEDRLDLVLTIDEDDLSMIPMVACVVTRDGAEPVQGARVALHEWDAETDGKGVVDIPRSLLAEAPSFLALDRGHVPHRVSPPARAESPTCEVEPAANLALERVAREVSWPERIEVSLPRVPLPGIEGRVVDNDGQPHAGVRVWLDVDLLDTAEDSLFGDALGSVATKSADDGSFRLPGLPGRAYTVLARSDVTLAAARMDGVLAGGGGITLTVARRGPVGTIEGTCRAPDGTPLPGVEVSAMFAVGPHSYRHPKEVPPATTDERGRFSFAALPAVPSHFSWEGRSVIPDQRPWDRVPTPNGEPWMAAVDLELHRRADVVFDRTGVEGDVWWVTLSREDGTPVFMNTFEWLPEHQLEGVSGTRFGEFEDGRTPVYTVPEGRLVARLMGEGERVFAERRFTLTAGEANPRVIDF